MSGQSRAADPGNHPHGAGGRRGRRGRRSGFGAVLAGVMVAGLVSAPPVVGTSPGVPGSVPQFVAAAPAGPPTVVVPMAKKKKRPRVAFASKKRLVVNIDPDLRGKKNWKFKLQRKSRGKWRKVGIYRTRGKSEIRKLKVKKGKYRVKVYARPGYRKVTTKAYRFTPTTPTTPIPPPAPPTPPPSTPPPTTPPPPILPDTTAPGVVTGLAVVDPTATSINLVWTNPADADLATVIVRRATGTTVPETPTDGATVALTSATAASATDAGLPVDTPLTYAVFTRDATGNTSPGAALTTRTLGPSVMDLTRVSVLSDGSQATGHSSSPAISADGRWIAYISAESNLVDDDTNGVPDVFLYDRNTGLTRRVSVRSDGDQATGGTSSGPAISADGRWITYTSYATNLVDDDTNGVPDVFLNDRDTGLTRRVSVRSDGDQATGGTSSGPAISADGRWITYTSYATNLVDDDTNGVPDVFLYDRDTGLTRRVSVRSDGVQATGRSGGPAISADGRWITYTSQAADLVANDTNNTYDVFLFDRDTGLTRRVSVSSDGDQATGYTGGTTISADGRWITYGSEAANLVDDDTNGLSDVFLYDRQAGLTRRISVRSDGGQAIGPIPDLAAPGGSYVQAISADGRWTTYWSSATNLVENDTNHHYDLFLYDWNTGLTRRVSVRSDGSQATGEWYSSAISADGQWITYSSDASDLVDNDTNGEYDVFLTRIW